MHWCFSTSTCPRAHLLKPRDEWISEAPENSSTGGTTWPCCSSEGMLSWTSCAAHVISEAPNKSGSCQAHAMLDTSLKSSLTLFQYSLPNGNPPSTCLFRYTERIRENGFRTKENRKKSGRVSSFTACGSVYEY